MLRAVPGQGVRPFFFSPPLFLPTTFVTTSIRALAPPEPPHAACVALGRPPEDAGARWALAGGSHGHHRFIFGLREHSPSPRPRAASARALARSERLAPSGCCRPRLSPSAVHHPTSTRHACSPHPPSPAAGNLPICHPRNATHRQWSLAGPRALLNVLSSGAAADPAASVDSRPCLEWTLTASHQPYRCRHGRRYLRAAPSPSPGPGPGATDRARVAQRMHCSSSCTLKLIELDRPEPRSASIKCCGPMTPSPVFDASTRRPWTAACLSVRQCPVSVQLNSGHQEPLRDLVRALGS